MKIEHVREAIKKSDPYGFDAKKFAKVELGLLASGSASFDTSRIRYTFTYSKENPGELSGIRLQGLQCYNIKGGEEGLVNIIGKISEQLDIERGDVYNPQGGRLYTFLTSIRIDFNGGLEDGIRRIHAAQNAFIALIDSRMKTDHRDGSGCYGHLPRVVPAGLDEEEINASRNKIRRSGCAARTIGEYIKERSDRWKNVIEVGGKELTVEQRAHELAMAAKDPKSGRICWDGILETLNGDSKETFTIACVRQRVYKVDELLSNKPKSKK
jgi:hypothetical protein